MAKLRPITINETAKHLNQVRQLLEMLTNKDVYGDSGFSADKDAILKIFANTKDNKKEDVLIRLTLIDSMYSTQMSRRYYALEELAEALVEIARNNEIKSLFLAFSKNPEKNCNEFNFGKNKNLFSECYGIGKDGSDKGVAISLISKYAYFLTGFRFPIYDSIACEMYPLVWHYCGFGDECPKLIATENGRIQGELTMILFVNAINKLLVHLDCDGATYDLLDRFLWFVGKIRRGNLSLVLSRHEYEETMNLYPAKEVITLNKRGKEKKSIEYFNIERVDLNEFKFLKNNNVLRSFFELAQFYGHK